MKGRTAKVGVVTALDRAAQFALSSNERPSTSARTAARYLAPTRDLADPLGLSLGSGDVVIGVAASAEDNCVDSTSAVGRRTGADRISAARAATAPWASVSNSCLTSA